MGGGDSLYDKIDRGIRGCKVVLTSITQKYALSANCRREVSLADALKKPIIPLLMEKSDWPPSGPMSMVFTQLLFINFCKDETVQLRWDGPKFDELLQKIHSYVPTNDRFHNEKQDRQSEKAIKGKEPTRTAMRKDEKSESNIGNVTQNKTADQRAHDVSDNNKTSLMTSSNSGPSQLQHNRAVDPASYKHVAIQQYQDPPKRSSTCIIL